MNTQQTLAKYSHNSSALIGKYNDTLLLYLPQELVDKILKFVVMTSKHPIFGMNLLTPIRDYFKKQYFHNNRFVVVNDFANQSEYAVGCRLLDYEEMDFKRNLYHFSLVNHFPLKLCSPEIQREISRLPYTIHTKFCKYKINVFRHILAREPKMSNANLWGLTDSISYIGNLGNKRLLKDWTKSGLIYEYYENSNIWKKCAGL